MYLQIGSVVVSPSSDYGVRAIDFGAGGDPNRTFTATIRCYSSGATAALADTDMRSHVAALGAALGRSTVYIVANTADSDRASAIALIAQGRQPWESPFAAINESRHYVDVVVRLAVEPYTSNANRVFLASPIGDEWPDATVTDISRNDESRCYAESGRWVVYADSSAEGQVSFYGDAVPDEVLVVEFDYDASAVSAGGNAFYATLTTLATDGGAAISSWTLINTSTIARGHVRKYIRVDDTAARFKLAIVADYTDAAVKASVWNIEVGVKKQANHRLVPGEASTVAGSTGIPYGWVTDTVAGVTWTSSGTLMRMEIGTNSAAAAYCTSVTDANYTGALTVVPGRRIGCRFQSQVASYTDGTFRVAMAFRDADNALVSGGGVMRDATAADASVVWTSYECVVPVNAVKAYIYWGVTGANATGNFNIGYIEFGEHVVETPGDISLSAMEGETETPLEVIGDVDPESDCHSAYFGVAPNNADTYIFEAEALTWTDADDTNKGATTSDAQYYPGTGTTGWYTGGATHGTDRKWASIDTAKVTPGTYLLLARHCSTGGASSYTSTVDCAESTIGLTGVSTVVTTPQFDSLGFVTLPSKRAWPSTAANITVGITASNSGTYAVVDRYVLIPVDLGGWAYFHHGTAGSDIDQLDILADGTILVDNAVTMTYCGGGLLNATSSDRLIVCAEEAASDETTHLVVLELLHTPRYNLWR